MHFEVQYIRFCALYLIKEENRRKTENTEAIKR